MRNDPMSNYIDITVMWDEILAFSDFMYKMEELNLVPSSVGLARKEGVQEAEGYEPDHFKTKEEYNEHLQEFIAKIRHFDTYFEEED
tara:strand:- start:235 stop:495 length:261 start_codon:yes stop_codon:yes gene_type:complete